MGREMDTTLKKMERNLAGSDLCVLRYTAGFRCHAMRRCWCWIGSGPVDASRAGGPSGRALHTSTPFFAAAIEVVERLLQFDAMRFQDRLIRIGGDIDGRRDGDSGTRKGTRDLKSVPAPRQ